MIISIVQFKPKLMDKEYNIEKILGDIRLNESDIILFPELSTTGYFYQTKEELSSMAEPFPGPTSKLLQEIATRENRIIIYGFAEKYMDRYYNSASILMPDSTKSRVYRKTHLFYKEKLVFEPGDTGFFIVEDKIRDIKIGTMICYDWRFPESARTLAMLGADLIVCPSNLVTHIWNDVMPTRAIENKVYLAVANRTGIEENNGESLTFNGLSTIYDYNGKELAHANEIEECILTAEIFPERTRDKTINAYNDILGDRRPEKYYR